MTLLGTATVFAAAGWTDMPARAGVLTVGTIVAIAAIGFFYILTLFMGLGAAGEIIAGVMVIWAARRRMTD